MARGDSRGGGYDAFIDKQSEKRKTLSAPTREDVASSSQAPNQSGNLEAPSSLGDLMVPSAGRAQPASTPEDYTARVAENQSYLEHPDTRAQMMQFASAMLGGSSPMAALGLAMQMPGRMELHRQAIAEKELEFAQKERGLNLEERGQNIQMRGQDITAKGAPSELMKTVQAAQDAEAAGDKKQAKIYWARAFQISNEFSAPQGQVTTFDENGNPTIKNVEGGKAWLDQQAALQKIEDQKQLELSKGASVNMAAEQIVNAIDNASNPNMTVTGIGALLNYIPVPSEARNVGDAIRTITANMTVDQLQAVRAASPTGGAFGNISNYEDQLLASTRVALDQYADAKTLRNNVMKARFLFDPTTMEARADIGKRWTSGQITGAQAKNEYQNLLNEYIMGKGATTNGVARDFSTPPPSVTDPLIKDNWNTILQTMPEELKAHMSPDDAAAFDQWLQTQKK